MRTILALLLTLATVPMAQAAAEKPLCSSLEDCLQKSIEQKRMRLPDVIIEQRQNCPLKFNPSSEQAKQCEADLLHFAQEALACPTSLKRHKEAVTFDNKSFDHMIKDSGSAEIPTEIKAAFYNLTQVADAHYKALVKPKWQLRAYKSKFVNAHAGSGGQIMVSSALWTSGDFSLGQIAAILGHEISHVLTSDSLLLGCLAHEWVAPDFYLTLEEMTVMFKDNMPLTLPRGQQWSQLSQSLEYRADRGSKELLRKAGWDPELMAHAIFQLQMGNPDGTSGSHPQFSARIKNLEN